VQLARPALLIALASSLVASVAHARSLLELPYPTSFGLIEAATYGEGGLRLGTAHFEVEELGDGRVRMTVRTGIDHGASNEASIVLEPVAGGRRLRAVEQRSESRDEQGRSLGVLFVDHKAGVGRCTPSPERGGKARSITLPDRERIANVALNLLFTPLAQGEEARTDFQLFLCRDGPRVVDFSAVREERAGQDRIVEIRYQPDLGPAIAWIAGGLLPEFSFWLDHDGNYLAHRIPLYSKGPEVLVVREGLTPATLAP